MSKSHWLFVFNPEAGSATDNPYLGPVFASLEHFEVVQTRGPGTVGRIVQEARESGYSRIVVAGGDGTINEAVNGLAPHWEEVEIGILPLGTGNDFARCLDLLKDPEEWVELLVKETGRRLDVAEVKTKDGKIRYFVNASTGGFGTQVGENLSAKAKDRWGALAYALTAAKTFPELKAYTVQIDLDEAEQVEEEAYAVVVANGGFIAGGIPIAPEAQPDDGLLDIVIVPALEAPALMTALTQLLIEREQSPESFIRRRAKDVKLRARPSFKVNTDGEIAGHLPATYKVHEQVLHIKSQRSDMDSPKT